jgi:microcompartment protein CcmK/EutM
MYLGRVIGRVWCTAKNAALESQRLLLVQPITPEGLPTGKQQVCTDATGAGAGETVYYCGGKECSFPFLPAEVPTVRFDGRRSLLNQVNQHLDNVHRNGTLSVYDAQSRQAFDFLSSSQARQAFDLDREPTTVRDRYGRYRFGQSVLLARRLVEAGVPLIRVNWVRVANALNNGHWDTHSKNTDALKQLMPLMDQTYSALLEDLEQRGLLEDTLVVWMAEFGRTPKINGNAGRDHWGHVFSTALAGGGVKGGVVHGASDKIAAYPKDGTVRPQDLTATIYHSLGISPESEIHDSQGRPLAITRGKVIHQIM